MKYKCSVCKEIFNFPDEVNLLLKSGEIEMYVESEYVLDIELKNNSEIICGLCCEDNKED